jgi:hypothetical protein
MAAITLPFKCDQCDRQFGSEHGMNVHKFRAHSGHNWSPTKGKVKIGRRFSTPNSAAEPKTTLTECPVCHQEYRNRPNLSHHMRYVHKQSIMDFPELMVGFKRRARHHKRRNLLAKIHASVEASKPAPVRGHVDYCPRCGQNIKAFELAAGFLT